MVFTIDQCHDQPRATFFGVRQRRILGEFHQRFQTAQPRIGKRSIGISAGPKITLHERRRHGPGKAELRLNGTRGRTIGDANPYRLKRDKLEPNCDVGLTIDSKRFADEMVDIYSKLP